MELISLVLILACIFSTLFLFSRFAKHFEEMKDRPGDKKPDRGDRAKSVLAVVLALLIVASCITASVFRAINAAATETALSDARAEGEKDGYSKGYAQGSADGYSNGYGDGKREASTSNSGGTGTGAPRAEPIASGYIGNKSTKKFHRSTCSYLPDEDNQIVFSSAANARASGYTACGHCDP